jgi:glycosyltransferase involved in cell wall biosynthesis
MKRRVLSIAYNELTNDNRVMNQALSLHNNGYEVTVLGYKINPDLPSVEKVNGITIRRVSISYTNPFIHRIPFLKFFYHELNLFITFLRIGLRNFDVLHCHDVNTLQFGVRVKLLKRSHVKLVYDAHEYETERNGLHGSRKIYIKLKEKLLIKFCDRVITVSDTIANEYKRLYGITKPEVILNCPILRSAKIQTHNIFREKFAIPKSNKILLYQGILSPGRGIDVILEAFDQLDLPDFSLVFMGEGVLESMIKGHHKFQKSVFLHPFVSGEVLLAHTSSAD